ncbi:MAG: LamG domain-containing protein, partial [Cytophagales bacterium]|nr:LamG domain-containing protein [Cytophagales bacterium]
MNNVIKRLTVFLIALSCFYLNCAVGHASAGFVNRSVEDLGNTLDSLRSTKKALRKLVELNRQRRDSVVNARAALTSTSVSGKESLTIQQETPEAFGPGIMRFSNSDLLMHLKLDTDGSDASGHGNSGTPGGDYTFVTEAHFDGSIHCNGIANGASGTSGGHVVLPDLGLNNLTEFTVSIWVKDEKATPDEGLIWFGDWHSGWGGIAHLWGNTIFHVGGVGTSGGGIPLPLESDDLGVWVMYTLVYDNGIMKAYKNGQYKSQIAVNVYIPKGQYCGLGRHWWGGSGEGTSTRYTGKIDEARVYSRAFTDSNVLALYNLTDPDQDPRSRVLASLNMNYILEYTPRIEVVDKTTNFGGLPASDCMADITYFDGLGRSMQRTAIGASPLNGADIILPMQYDDYGRESKRFLPYTAAGNGSYQPNAIDKAYTTSTDHYQFYMNSTNGVVDDP